MRIGKTLQAAGLAFAVVLLVASLASAQVSTSNISGTVTDKSGSVIVGAKVVAKHEATGVTYETATTSSGDYAISSVPPGAYSITVTLSGFRTFTSVHNTLNVGAPLVVDAAMEVGQISEVVQVESSYAKVETTNATISDVVTRREVVELPLNGRNPLNLIILEPGLVQRTNSAAGSDTHVFGSRDRAHNVTIDGIDANESSNPDPQLNIYRLNPDNVQEYRVVTHNATPEFGRNSGANVAVATRSGTNEFHGDVFYFHRNTVLNANEFFNSAKGQPKPVLLLHQWGADGGGPIAKNRTFFFASYQGNRINQTLPISQALGATPRVYTNDLQSGIFRFFVPDSGNPLVVNGVTITRNSVRLVDPKTGALIPQVGLCPTTTSLRCVRTYNIFTSGPTGFQGVDPTIATLIGAIPRSNDFTVGDGLNFAGFSWNAPSRFVGPHFLGRIDHKFNENNNIFGRILWSDFNNELADIRNNRPAVFPGFPPLGEVSRAAQGLAFSYRRVFSSNVVNEFTTGFSRFHFFFALREANRTNLVPPPYAQECFGTASFRTVDMPFCNTPHTERVVSAIQFVDNLSYVRGAHTVRTGINFRFYRHNDARGVPGGFNMSPTIVFDRTVRDPTKAADLGASSAFPVPSGISSTDLNNLKNAIAELVGIPAQVQQAYQANFADDKFESRLFVLGTRAKQYDYYIQDEWKLGRTFTMTYGFRWEWNRPPRDCCNRTFVPDLAIDGSQGKLTYVPAKSWFDRRNANAFAPRISLAWNPRGGKTVFRAGYGIAFDTISTFQITAIGGMVPGSVLQCRVKIQDTAATAAPCAALPTPNNVRLTALVAAVNPFQLGAPTATPSSQFSPANKPRIVAPDTGAFDPNLKVPTVHEWSLTIQRELPWGFVGQIGYVGKRGMRLYRAFDVNQLRTDQPGFKESFLIAQQNVLKGCKPDGTGCPSGVTGSSPTLLLQLVPASTLNTFSSDFTLNGLGEVARRVDQTDITARGFAPNYFRPNAQFSQIFYFDSGGDSYYHAGIVQLRRRFEKGLTMGFGYTYGKSIDDMSIDPVGASSSGGLGTTGTASRAPTDWRNFRLDRSRSDFDNRHVVVANFLYELPFGRGKSFGKDWPGVLNQIAGGWTLTGISTYQSGEPFTINSGERTANGFKQSRADLRGPMPSSDLKSAAGISGPVLWITSDLITNPADPNFNCRQVVGTQSFFCIPPPGENGMGRNVAQGPSFWNVDLGVLKNFPVTEQVRLQFRAEFFNVLNHPNFENPRNATEGSPTLTSGAFGQTCCITAAVPASATIVGSGEPNRIIQFSAKIIF